MPAQARKLIEGWLCRQQTNRHIHMDHRGSFDARSLFEFTEAYRVGRAA
jgi:hypothetical protein